MKGEKPITFDDYKTFAFLRDRKISSLLAEAKGVEERTALVEKWYLAYKKEQG